MPMYHKFCNFETNNYSKRLFTITNEALGTACFADDDHPRFSGFDSVAAQSPSLTLLKFYKLELYFKTMPKLQRVLEHFVKNGAHKQKPYFDVLHNKDIDPLEKIEDQLRLYAAKNNLPIETNEMHAATPDDSAALFDDPSSNTSLMDDLIKLYELIRNKKVDLRERLKLLGQISEARLYLELLQDSDPIKILGFEIIGNVRHYHAGLSMFNEGVDSFLINLSTAFRPQYLHWIGDQKQQEEYLQFFGSNIRLILKNITKGHELHNRLSAIAKEAGFENIETEENVDKFIKKLESLLESYFDKCKKKNLLDSSESDVEQYKYFKFTKQPTLKDLKAEFHQLALKHHSDKGGSDESFAEMREEYKRLTSLIEAGLPISLAPLKTPDKVEQIDYKKEDTRKMTVSDDKNSETFAKYVKGFICHAPSKVEFLRSMHKYLESKQKSNQGVNMAPVYIELLKKLDEAFVSSKDAWNSQSLEWLKKIYLICLREALDYNIAAMDYGQNVKTSDFDFVLKSPLLGQARYFQFFVSTTTSKQSATDALEKFRRESDEQSIRYGLESSQKLLLK